MKTTHVRKAKTIYAELVRARESTIIVCVLTETQRQAEEWESLIVEEGRFQGCPDWRWLTRGSWGAAH